MRLLLNKIVRRIRRLRQRLDSGNVQRRLVAAEAAIERFPTVLDSKPSGLPGELIISLTSYPPRFHCLAPTLMSLLDQTVRADRTILWIAHDDMAALPADVLALREHGLDIRDCEDLRSYKKLIPCLEAYPEAYVVTADDDLFYEPEWLGWLVDAARAYPGHVIGGRTHIMHLDRDGLVMPYREWGFDTQLRTMSHPRKVMFPTGVGGILYPPGCLSPEVHDRQLFMQLCPQADDVWFFWMARRAGTGHVRIREKFQLVNWPSSQEDGLMQANVLSQGNDRQIAAVQAHYGKLADQVRP